MQTPDFFATHPVFSLDEATAALAPPGGRSGTVQRLKHHLASGRLSLVARGIYAVVPRGLTVATFRPDPFAVAAAARRDAIFTHHSALELLGVAHSAWSSASVYTARRRGRLALGSTEIAFFDDPLPFRTDKSRHLGTRKVERSGRILEVTGPERTLAEGLRRPALAGGVDELLQSAGAFPTLDLALLHEILLRYDTARLWTATGWLLQQYQRSFSVPDAFLDDLERRRPAAAIYLQREQRGGRLAPRWNLIVPEIVYHLRTADER